MDIILTGRDSPTRRIIEGEVKWLMIQLNLLNSRCNLEIVPLKGLSKTNGYRGVCGRVDNLICFGVDTGLGLNDLITTVAHEMIHVKQLAKGTLRYKREGKKEVILWCGKKINTKNMHYFDRPWEVEAYAKQTILSFKFQEWIAGANERVRKI